MRGRAMNAITVAVLAGGASRRMGVDKSFVELGGKLMIQRTLEQVQALQAPLLLVTNAPDRYRQFQVPMVGDVVLGKGSLGGIYSALVHSTTPYTLCVACDMPFLNVDLMTYLVSLCSGFDAVVPVVDGQPQGLHAVYHRRCAKVIRQLMDRNALRISDLFDQLRVRLVGESALRLLDPELRSFTNLNTPEELAHAYHQIDEALPHKPR